jgi:hypothetical protein
VLKFGLPQEGIEPSTLGLTVPGEEYAFEPEVKEYLGYIYINCLSSIY